MSKFRMLLSASAVLAVATFIWASEAVELREKAEAMHREAAELAEQGHKEEAANLKRKAMAMLKEAERHGHLDQRHSEIVRMEQLLDKLRQKEKQLEEQAGADEALSIVRREAEQIEMKLRELSHRPHREHRGPDEDIARRLEHMRIALEHLNQAGLHDIAEHVAERAEAAERELHEHQRHHEGDVMHEVMKQLEELRHEVGRLRDDVNELRKKR